jgi:hypothetical protein
MFCMQRKTTGKRGQRRGEVTGMSDCGCCLRWFLTVALGGDRRWRCSGCFSFSPLLLLPLAFRLFYCSSSFFPFSPLVLGKEMPMVMLSFVCWFLASLTFSSSLFLLPIPRSAASGSCGWCCRKMKLMVMFFFLFFSAGFFFVLIFLSLLPPVSIVSPSVFFCSSISPLFYLSLLLCSSLSPLLSHFFPPPLCLVLPLAFIARGRKCSFSNSRMHHNGEEHQPRDAPPDWKRFHYHC